MRITCKRCGYVTTLTDDADEMATLVEEHWAHVCKTTDERNAERPVGIFGTDQDAGAGPTWPG